MSLQRLAPDGASALREPAGYPDRMFNHLKLFGDDVIPKQIEMDYFDGFTTIACEACPICSDCGGYLFHKNHIVIAVDGACPKNGCGATLAATGVYFGHDSSRNQGEIIKGEALTNQVAELTAGIRGLRAALDVKYEAPKGASDLKRVLIKSDSSYLVKGMTEYIYKWKQNGYKNVRNAPIHNAILFQELEELVIRLNNLKVDVRFWHVKREHNVEADSLANEALQSHGKTSALRR